MQSCVRYSLSIATAFLLGATTAGAATFTAGTSGPWLGDPISFSGPSPILEIRNGSREIGSLIQEQRAGFSANGGGVGVEAFVSSAGYPGINEFSAYVSAFFHDVVFSVAPDRTDITLPPNPTIDVLVNLNLDGLITLSQTAGASAAGSISVQINNVTVGSYQITHGASGVTETATGVLGAAAGSQVGLGFGYLLTVPVNVPVDVGLGAIASAFVNGPTGHSSFADVDFFNTLTFDPNQPFTLPDGFTVNSASAGIVDNQVVPEPAIGLLLSSFALARLAWTRRRSGPSCS